ncbi:unnamed protein product [Ectocarpus sp. 13 AM-2016]
MTSEMAAATPRTITHPAASTAETAVPVPAPIPLSTCTDNEFDCIFPDCGDTVASSGEERCLDDYWGDTYCDPINNHLSCGYDGGDVRGFPPIILDLL